MNNFKSVQISKQAEKDHYFKMHYLTCADMDLNEQAQQLKGHIQFGESLENKTFKY